jgi:two-component system, LytTR family, response regulator LytT
MLNVVFCDDDYEFLARILAETKTIFKNQRIPACLYTLTDGNKLIENLKTYNPYYDIVFLDIDMPLINGKEVARKMRLLDKKFKLVFVTSYEKEAINTFEYEVIGFLPKNQIKEKLPEIIKRVVDAINLESLKIQLFNVDCSEGIKSVKIPLDDIMYFECVNKKVFLYTRREVFALHRYKFSEIIQKYTEYNFVDIHRTCIVNIKYIFSVDELEIVLDNGVRLPLSRRKRGQVIDSFIQIVNEGISQC